MIKELDDLGISYMEYNNSTQVNAKDTDGVIQTFYPTTGTIVIHASNARSDRRMKVIRDKTLEQFIKGITTPRMIDYYFKDQED